MKNTKKHQGECAAQVGRLTAIELLNDTQENELVKVAIELAPSVPKLKEAVSDMVREWDKVPTPKQLAEFLKERFREAKGDSDCTTCYGSGKTYAWHLITYNEHGKKKNIQRITWQQYQELGPKINKDRQRVYQLPVDCSCKIEAAA